MAKLSAVTRNALSVVAHAAMAADFEKNVFKPAGHEGFYKFWLKSQSASDRETIREFEALSKAAHEEFSRLMNEDAAQ